MTTFYLLVRLEGNVSADHVVEQDAEGPDGGFVPVVLATLDPLRRGVYAGTWTQQIGTLRNK